MSRVKLISIRVKARVKVTFRVKSGVGNYDYG